MSGFGLSGRRVWLQFLSMAARDCDCIRMQAKKQLAAEKDRNACRIRGSGQALSALLNSSPSKGWSRTARSYGRPAEEEAEREQRQRGQLQEEPEFRGRIAVGGGKFRKKWRGGCLLDWPGLQWERWATM